MIKYFIPFFIVSVVVSSCASYSDLNQSLKFEEDDIYYTNDFQHRLNKQALLMNNKVAMPDSVWEYYNASYANSMHTSYTKRLDKFDSSDTSQSYMEDNEKEYYSTNSSSNNNSNWRSNLAMGTGFGAYYGYNAYYRGYQPNYYYSSNSYNQSYVNQRNQVATPRSYETTYNRFTPGANSRIVTPTSNTRTVKPYINSNPGYKTNGTDRTYRTRTNSQTGGYQPSFNSSRTGGGTYTPSGNVSGYRRR